MQIVKLSLLYVLRTFGAFGLARRLTGGGLRILCWHGIVQDDEHRFRPSLFISPAVLRARISWLKRKGFPILTLDEAVHRLRDGSLPPCATVLTLDDGWASWRIAAPIFQGLPVTAYVASGYVERPEPVPNIFAQYAYWKSGKDRLTTHFGTLGYPELWAKVSKLSLDERAALLPEIAEASGVDLDRITQDRRFSILSSGELHELGWDMQLHTHHHEWSADPVRVVQEIKLNAAYLKPVARSPLVHLCYPSGEYYRENFSALSALGILSATTCEGRLNYPGDNPLALGRLIDSSNVPQIVFEAQVSGIFEFARRLVNWSRGEAVEGLAPT
jgi:peptidoglycan/xylan/chitin deacetylase (PgdA/CDA1 family)